MLVSLQVQVTSAVPVGLPRLLAPAVLVRQALLNIVVAAVQSVPGGRVSVSASVHMGRACVQACVTQGLAKASSLPACTLEKLQMARELVSRCGGDLEVSPGSADGPFSARLVLPAEQAVTVLVIDDNRDTLQLLKRYLDGTCYRFVPLVDPAQALATAEAEAPQIIVLDVMLPGMDGWELLGALREHPSTEGIPVIVCTILPQDTLALALGAAAFLRKPLTKETFLQALDAQVMQPSPGCA
jgi:CheY-like chemotaxis protein